MITANVHEAKTNLSKLIEKVLHGKEVIIAKAGKPVVKIVEYKEKPKTRIFGLLKGKIKVPDDFNEESEKINKLFYAK